MTLTYSPSPHAEAPILRAKRRDAAFRAASLAATTWGLLGDMAAMSLALLWALAWMIWVCIGGIGAIGVLIGGVVAGKPELLPLALVLGLIGFGAGLIMVRGFARITRSVGVGWRVAGFAPFALALVLTRLLKAQHRRPLQG